jgi:hypothetical protein
MLCGFFAAYALLLALLTSVCKAIRVDRRDVVSVSLIAFVSLAGFIMGFDTSVISGVKELPVRIYTIFSHQVFKQLASLGLAGALWLSGRDWVPCPQYLQRVARSFYPERRHVLWCFNLCMFLHVPFERDK